MNQEGEEESVWKQLLQNVSSNGGSQPIEKKKLLVLGNTGSGKSSLIARLQNEKFNPKEHPVGTGLEYSYIDAKKPGSDDIVSRLGVYTLDGNEAHSNLLSFVLNNDNFNEFVGVIVADMSKPWTLLDTLHRWVDVLQHHIENNINQDAIDEGREKLKHFWQVYESPLLTAARIAEAQEEGREPEELDEEIEPKELTKGVLQVNLGIPLIFVITKSDYHAELEGARDYRQEHFDFIQIHLRQLALQYGAALFYTGKDDLTSQDLYQYLLHRAFGKQHFPFTTSENVSSRSGLIVPAGWDSAEQISEISSDLKNIQADADFGQVIQPPPSPPERSEIHDPMDEQEFLRAQEDAIKKTFLSKPGASRIRTGSTTSSSTTTTTTKTKRSIDTKALLEKLSQTTSRSSKRS